MSGDDKGREQSPPVYPEWLPSPIVAWIEANRDHPEHVAGAMLINHLAAEPRLQTLWAELTKCKPRGFAYPACAAAIAEFCDAPPDDETERQGIALIYLFKQLLHIAITIRAAKTEADQVMRADDMRKRAVWLRSEADDTDLIPDGAGGIDWKAVAAGMRAKADVLDQAAAALGVYRLTVPNARSNPAGLDTASRVSNILKTLFGKPIYRQSAAIAQVLTGEIVTFEQVRDVARKHPTRVKFLSKSR